MANYEIIATLSEYPYQGIQTLIDKVYLWNPSEANELIIRLNELIEEIIINRDYNRLNNKPVLDTDNEDSLDYVSDETIQGTIKLHRVSKTGSYNSLRDLPPLGELAAKDQIKDEDVADDAEIARSKLAQDVVASLDLADIAIQPGGNISELTNDADYQNVSQVTTSISEHNTSTTAHSDIRSAISAKQDILTAGTNVDITDNVISATDTKYTAGNGLTLAGTQFSANVVNNITSTSTTNALSANMGKELQDQINNLKSRGRYLSIWNCTTGLAETTPTVDPYEYRAGDYFIVGVVGTTNYRPTGTQYSESTPSTVIETGDVKVNDTYYYDGTTWTLLDIGQVTSTFASLGGSPYDNSNLAAALNAKQDELTAGENIDITNNVISATDTKYTAGTGISISDDNVISNTQTSAEWGNITGDIQDQEDLQAELALKQNVTDNTLTTTAKTIVGAINELDSRPSAPAIDNKTITKNASQQLQAVAVIDQADTSVGLKEWTGSEASYQELSVKESNTIYYTFEDAEEYWKEFYGYPLRVLYAIANNLDNYKIYGNSEQDGTPTPANPVEVISVGDKTVNLFDYDKQTWTSGILDVGSGTVGTNANYKTTGFIDILNAGNTYSIGFNQTDSSATGTSNRICFYNSNKTFIGSEPDVSVQYDEVKRYTRTLTVPSNTKYIRYSVRITDTDIQIEEGSTATPYVPYGYQIPVVVQGKNLFDMSISHIGIVLNSDTGEEVSSTYGSVTKITADPSVEYTWTAPISGTQNTIICSYDSNDAYISTLVNENRYAEIATFTTPSNCAYIKVSEHRERRSLTMLVKGSTIPTSYEPYSAPITPPIYLNAPLRKVGNYADVLDYKEGQIIRNVGVKVFDGTESWFYGGNSTGFGFYHRILDCKTNGKALTDIICTNLPTRTNPAGGYSQNPSIGYFDATSDSITVRCDEFLDEDKVTKWKSYLADQYANGTPVVIYYPLATATTESITAPDIAMFEGTNTITTDTTVSPSDMYCNAQVSQL